MRLLIATWLGLVATSNLPTIPLASSPVIVAAAAAAVDFDDAAMVECRRYCQMSFLAGPSQITCLKKCDECKITAAGPDGKYFKAGVDAKCDKTALTCMQLAGGNFAKLDTCAARDVCYTKHTTCLGKAIPPPAPPPPPPPEASAPEPEETVKPITAKELNTWAEEACTKSCLSKTGGTAKRCAKRCQCSEVAFEVGQSQACDDAARTCVEEITDDDGPRAKCAEKRLRCSKKHEVCRNPESAAATTETPTPKPNEEVKRKPKAKVPDTKPKAQADAKRKNTRPE